MVSAPTSGDVTNLRWYKRALNGTEIQRNYMSGCHGEPYNCASLILYAKLDQTSGKVTPEQIYGNNGQLIGYAPNRTNVIGGTSAWIEACCPKIVAFEDYTCGAQDCNPDFVELYASIDGVVGATNDFIMNLVPSVGACPVVSNAYAGSLFEGINASFALTNVVDNLDAVDQFVAAFNTAYTGTGIYAIDNLNTVVIRIPKSYAGSEEYCNQPFSICFYDGTVPATPTGAYTGSFTVSYPKGQMANCCVPATDCGLNNDAPIMI